MNRSAALASALLFFAAPAFAADAVLVKLKGRVYVRAQGADKDILAKGGEELLFGDAVRTEKDAVAQVEIEGRGAVLLRGESAFKLEGTPANTLLRFRFGEFLIGVRKALGQGESFRVRTPAAVAAVRGTLFWGKSDEAKTSTYAGLGHIIAVTGAGKTVTVRAGETVTVPLGAAPSEPKPHEIPMSYWNNFAVDGDIRGLGELMDKPAPSQK